MSGLVITFLPKSTCLNFMAAVTICCDFGVPQNKVSYLDSILKSRDITLSTEVCLVKAILFPVVMYECKSWTVKKAERQRIDAFELWCWRRLLRVPWTARRSNVYTKGDQVWVFIGRTDVEAETPILWPPDAKSWLI